MSLNHSWQRFSAIVRKEFTLMRRDPSVLLIMAVLPLILVSLACYAININPKHVPTALINYDDTDITRNIIQSMKNTEYFNFIPSGNSVEEAHHLLRSGKASIVMTIPANFTKDMIRQLNPGILFEDGAIDAFSTSKALSTLPGIKKSVLSSYHGALNNLSASHNNHFSFIMHRLYDPEHNMKYSAVPGIIGLVLMLTMLMITTIIPFRDIQGGTIDYLLVSATRPIEIILAEIAPYILIGYIQLVIGILLSFYVFQVPCEGSAVTIFICGLPYIIAELSLGLTVSTFCRTQFQAIQVINLLIALSFILSGFVFPINGMPLWAQKLSNFLPLTHFLQIIRGVMLRGSSFEEVSTPVYSLIFLGLTLIIIAILRFKKQFET